MPSTVTPLLWSHKKSLKTKHQVIQSQQSLYLCFDPLQLCSQQLQVPLQALNLDIPVRQKAHRHSVLAHTQQCWHTHTACWNQTVWLTITGYSEKQPGSPVIEASIRRPKRLIEYVKVLRRSKIINEKKLTQRHGTTVWVLVWTSVYSTHSCICNLCVLPAAVPVRWRLRRRWPRWAARGRRHRHLVALVRTHQGWPPLASRAWPVRLRAES